jgi:hypothetical protein
MTEGEYMDIHWRGKCQLEGDVEGVDPQDFFAWPQYNLLYH